MAENRSIVELPDGGAAPAGALPHETARARWMFWIGLGWLAILALMLPHGGADRPIAELPLYTPLLPVCLFACWAVVLAEGLAGYLGMSERPKAALWRLALVALVPPFRMAIAPHRPNRRVWLPRVGWLDVGAEALLEMEHRAAIPMILATLLIVPVLVVDFGFSDTVDASRGLEIGLALLMALIWFSFALEFVVMVSLAPGKLAFCRKNWINIVIIVLPLVAFLRSLQIFRFLRIARAGKLARAYRLRGLVTRVLKIALAFNLIGRIMSLRPESYAAQLEETIAERERELADLRRRLAETRARLDEGAAGAARSQDLR